MTAESGTRALAAGSDLLELLRLAQSALERLEQEVHGPAYEKADHMARDVHRLRRLAETLHADIERLVSREASATLSGRHPLRRASDRIAAIPPAGPRN